jgi:hypothetical protein
MAISRQSALGADGPAYHLARASIGELKDIREKTTNK